MKKYLVTIILTISILMILTSCSNILEKDNYGSSIEIYSDTSASAEMLERTLELDELERESDIIASIILTDTGNIKKTEIYDDRSETLIAIAESLVVSAKIIDSYKNIDDVKEISIALPNGNIPALDFKLKTNQEYVFCLKYNPELDAYNLVSFSQGVFYINDDNTISSRVESYKLNDFITEIESLCESN